MPADLVLCDPPYGLGRGTGRHYSDGHGYRRDHTRIVSGYQDVAPGEYEEFTHGWTQAAAAALRPGGQLAVVTGPQRAGIVQYAAEQAGLTWVSTIAARREFPLATTRRPASAHWSITVMCRGPLASARRVFHPPADLPAARTGHPYPLDWWPDNGRADRPGLLRYDNSLPLRLVQRTVSAFSDRGSTSSTRSSVPGPSPSPAGAPDELHRRRRQQRRHPVRRRPAASRTRLARRPAAGSVRSRDPGLPGCYGGRTRGP